MAELQLLLNGLIAADSHADALRSLRDLDLWINAYPHGSGLPTGKIRPFRTQYAPVILSALTVLGILPYLEQNNAILDKGPLAQFAFAALVTLHSAELSALHYAIQQGTWLASRLPTVLSNLVWSAPAPPGRFAHLTGEE